MKSLQQIFKVTVTYKGDEPSQKQGDVDLGLRSPQKNGPTVARSYSIDINMSPHCDGFEECPEKQKQLIVQFIKKHIEKISSANIYAETKSFKHNRDTNEYEFYGHAKLHWHGIITMYREADSKNTVDTLIKDMRKRFSCSSATSTFRAVFYKKLKNKDHLNARVAYQTKQQPYVIEPISFDNRVRQKNI